MDDLFSKPLAELSPADKRALLAKLLAEAAAPEEQTFPLSHGQKALWFIHQLTPGTAAYNVASAIRVKGPLHVPVLRAAVQAVVDRHASLRTTFSRAANGEPLQTVHAAGSYAYTEVDATGLAWDEVYRRLSGDGYYPFDLAQAPLFRVSLYTLAPEEHVLLLVMNHIIVDFWSMSILMQDFLALYGAMSRGMDAPLPPLETQFKDAVDWERKMVAGADGEALFRYWENALAGELPVLKLPEDRPRPPVWSDEGSLFIFPIGKETIHRLRTLAHAEGATLFMILLATFQVLMHRISGQDDLLVGSPVAGRSLADFDTVVGYFVNTVVLRASLAAAPEFRAFLGTVRQTVLGAFAHQDYPFPLLVERLQPRRSPAYSPVFQVMFNLVQPRRMEQAGLARILLGDAGGKIRFNELEMESFSLEQRTANFDLTLTAVEVEESLFAQWQFSTRLFDTATIARLAACYETLLNAVLADPDRRVSELSLLTAEERQELLIERNRKTFDLPAAQGFLQLFEAQVERTPENMAVVSGAAALTYSALNAAADRLGRILVERQAGPETLIAIYAQRGVNFLTALLAAFKAGGAYLPLDPFYPARRLRQMLENSRAPLVLVEESLVENLADVLSAVEPGPAMLVIEDLLRADRAQTNLPQRSDPGNLAYVIYTSGSTGVPKGAMVAAEGMLSHLFAKIADLELTAADVVAQTASQCFDISVWQYLAALLVGGRTHVVDAATAGDPRLLLRHAEEHGITILESVPSLISEMVREAAGRADRPPLGALRWLVATGEDLPPELCRRWLACYPRVPLLNAYGPTECSDDVTHHAVPEPPGEDAVRMPVGRPIANMRIYVLDRSLEPVPAGVTGELCAGGLGVGRGYLGAPERTAAVFVPDPFSPRPGGRLYRTGDAARWTGGTLELLGRLDSQVKVRGQRIELQEIELSLAQHPNVGEAVVLALRAPSGENRLVAYVVPRESPVPPTRLTQELRAFLEEKLPQSMVPSVFVLLDALPHGPSGKVDRGALPAPDGERPELANTFVAPRTEVESRLAELWAAVLSVERVGIHDNFFELGGHSLLGIQLLSRVRDVYEMDVPARGFFENPTVAGLARLVSGVSDIAPAGSPAKSWSRVADLLTEVSLDPAITPQGPPRAGLDTIFLTGATGFLGSHLLAELLQQTAATVHCLVRSRSAEDGMRKIARGLESYGLGDLGRPDLAHRVRAVPGDLARPLLGLTLADFADLAERVDTVIHNGAWVSFVLPYEVLKPANVLGMREALRFACQGSAKSFHAVSSLAVCPLTGARDGVVREDDDLRAMEHVLGGYAQSKWVAEGLAGVARSRGLPVTVYRPGMITGHSRTGATNTADFMAGFLKGCIQLGAAPAVGTAIEMTPVDYVSRAIVEIIRQPHSAGRVYHLSNPRVVAWDELVAWVKAAGYPIRSEPFEEWLAELFALGEGMRENALYPFVSLLAERDAELQETAGLPLAAVRLPRYDCANTLNALAGTPVACPPMDERLFATYLSYFVRSGFLPAAPERS